MRQVSALKQMNPLWHICFPCCEKNIAEFQRLQHLVSWVSDNKESESHHRSFGTGIWTSSKCFVCTAQVVLLTGSLAWHANFRTSQSFRRNLLWIMLTVYRMEWDCWKAATWTTSSQILKESAACQYLLFHNLGFTPNLSRVNDANMQKLDSVSWLRYLMVWVGFGQFTC